MSNTLNERSLGTSGADDSCISVLTPNLLLLGRTGADNPGNLYQTKGYRTSLVSNVYNVFRKKWEDNYAPTVIRQGKWYKCSPNLRLGDIVAVCNQNLLRSSHYLTKVNEVFPSTDRKVRKVAIVYKNFRIGENVHHYNGGKVTVIYRSVQKLALLVFASGK